jgi:hypothetical protein
VTARRYVVHPLYTVPYTVAPTTASTVTTTTIASIAGHLPVSPSTVPFTTRGTSAHVDPVLAWLSGAGFLAVILIMAGRFVMTRTHRA